MTIDKQSPSVILNTAPRVMPGRLAQLAQAVQGFEDRAINTFGERLSAARIKAGLTQAQVAEIVGKERQAVIRWEKNKGVPLSFNTTEFLPLARRLKVSVEWLLYGVDISPGSTTDPRIEKVRGVVKEFSTHYPALSKILDILGKASDDDQEAAKVREDVIGIRKVYRELEDLVDG